MIGFELIKVISSIDNRDISLPNSVFTSNGKIVITDSGNNRILAVNENNTEVLINIGNFGIGKYKFKEPVYSTIYNNFLFVCDWYNNRIVIYKDEVFYKQVGIYSRISCSLFFNLALFIKGLGFDGSFTSSHFNSALNTNKKTSASRYFKNLIKGLFFYVRNPLIVYESIKNNVFMAKPNGIAVVGDYIFFTQKNNYAITKYNYQTSTKVKELSNVIDGNKFGRLGQITSYKNKLYACDETHNKVWVLDYDLNVLDDFSITNYNVFSIDFSRDYIVTCGVKSYSVFNKSFDLLYQSDGMGEYHGVSINNSKIYVCNRIKNRIEVYDIRIKDCD